jgi:hypothetical protein
MMLKDLCRIPGDLSAFDEDDRADAFDVMHRTALNFLISGGNLSLRDWYDMDEDERAVFYGAGEQFMKEFAALQGICNQSTLHAGRVISEYDDGELLRDTAVNSIKSNILMRRCVSDG